MFMTQEGAPPELGSAAIEVPAYRFPEDAARAVALAARHGVWRTRPEGAVPAPPGCRPDEAAAIISEELANGETWMSPARVGALLRCYGLPLIATRQVSDVSGAVAAAGELGVPVALKAVAAGLLHKTDAGGVALASGRRRGGARRGDRDRRRRERAGHDSRAWSCSRWRRRAWS